MISGVAFCFVALLAYVLWRNSRHHTLKDIRGPPSHSFLLGSEKVFRNAAQVRDLEFPWVREFGPTWAAKGCFGFSKRTVANEITRLFTGKSILITDSIDHQRHRKIMNPAFGTAQLQTFLPVFRHSAARLSQKWKDIIQFGNQAEGCAINVNQALSRVTLDVLGEVAFDHHFGVLNNNGVDNDIDSLLHPSSWDLLFQSTWKYLPQSILYCLKYLPYREYRRFSTYLQTAIRTGQALISEKAAGTEKGSKDIMSILVQSNRLTDAGSQLSEIEMLSQIAALLVAGHDTTAITLTWLLYELSKHPKDQQRIRDEIKAARAHVEARGDDDLLPSDLNAMTFTNAVIKEGLRFHPIVPNLAREATSDDVIPLAQPIETKSGKIIHEIPISKGQGITASICTYNRLKTLWGEDADQWNPNRFLDGNKERSLLGVFANLSAGIRACIGWRFAVLELQAVLVELIENFEYRFPEGVEIIRLNAGLMIPMVAGKVHDGSQMPLRVFVVS
ncbi:cytochrome P450 [Rhizopogon salebrosus TDB-379]|nr:cytochrome P450 [Rhizopogon salebrosus TDB-379]